MPARLRLLRYLWTDLWRPIAPAKHHPDPRTWSGDRVTAAWLGHATVLINFYGCVILTDPVFFDRIGIRLWPFTIGPKRHLACALRPEELPPVDVVLVTHAHMDHLDKRSLRALSRNATVVTASRTADLIPRRFRRVVELAWDETIELPSGLTVTARRLLHWGARMHRDDYRGYNAYLLERGGKRLCIAGDTARTDARPLASRGPIDLMALPISAYNPWIRAHCTPEEAVAMADEARARYLLPVHHETFRLSWEPLEEPIRRFRAALDPARLALAEVGETFALPE